MTPAAALHLLAQAEKTHKRAHWRLAARALGAIVAEQINAKASGKLTDGREAFQAVRHHQATESPSATTTARSRPILCEWLARRGLSDDGGELAGRDLDSWHRGKPFRRKLVREGGLPLERASVAAFEAGLFPDMTWERFEPRGVEIMLATMERELRADFPALHPEAYDPELEGEFQ